MAELSLWLDSYDDLYSDFDSRYYLKRRLSEDFIDELKEALRFRTEQFDSLVLLLPHRLRNSDIEKDIPASVREQLGKRLQVLHQKAKGMRRRGILLLAAGMLIMIVDSIISYKFGGGYVFNLLRIILEPAGWFMIWNGLDFLIYEYRTIMRDTTFYEAVCALSVHFRDDPTV